MDTCAPGRRLLHLASDLSHGQQEMGFVDRSRHKRLNKRMRDTDGRPVVPVGRSVLSVSARGHGGTRHRDRSAWVIPMGCGASHIRERAGELLGRINSGPRQAVEDPEKKKSDLCRATPLPSMLERSIRMLKLPNYLSL